MRKAIISFTSALTLAALASSPTMAAQPAKAPTNTAECMGLLYGFSMAINGGKVSADIVKAMKPKAKEMAGYCQSGKFDKAFTLHTEISKAMAAGK